VTALALPDDLMWGEAPRYHGGTLWASDTQAGQLVSIDAGGIRRRPLDSPTNGLWFLPDGRLAAARWSGKRIDVLVGNRFELYSDIGHLVRDRVGDMTGTSDGWLYVDDMGQDPHSGNPVGRILAIDPDGHARVAADELRFPNGLAVLDGTLIAAETHGARLTAFDIASDGGLGNRRTWTDLAELFNERHRPDGIWPAADGSVWVAATAGEAFVRVRGAEAIESIPVPGEFAIACCLDRTSLYLSTARSTDPQLALLTEALPQKKIRGRIVCVDVPR